MAVTGTSQGAGRWDWLLPSLVDHRAQTEPDLVYMQYPASPATYKQGLKTITYRKFANAINGAALWLEQTLGGKSDRHEVLAYMGPADPRYPIFTLAAGKAGYAILLLSPRNSLPAQQNLLTLTGCSKLLTSSPEPPYIRPIAAETGSDVFHVPTLDQLLEEPHPHYSYNKAFEQGRRDPFLILHTSGSTSLPKPIVYSQEFPATYQNMLKSPPGEGNYMIYDVYDGKHAYSMIPPFHMAGLLINLFSPIFNKTTVVIPPYAGPPTAAGIGEALEKTEIDIVLSTPLTCRELVDDPALLEVVASKVEYYAFAGGDCPEHLGNIMTQRFKFWSGLGQSEYGSLPMVRQKGEWARDEWSYIRLSPAWGCEFRHFDGNVFEQWIVKTPEYEHAQTVFKNFPELQEYCTKDLFTPHPTKPDAWRYRGRLDDIIVFLTGEKTNPNSFEAIVTSHPEVNAALMIGTQRFQAGLLIEPKTALAGPIERAELLERLWPVVKRANTANPAHAQVVRSHVLFTTSEKPMLRAGKGTVQRYQTTSRYKREIDKLYEDADRQTADRLGTSKAVQSLSHAELVQLLQTLTLQATKWKQIDHEDDFFSLGMDSQQVLQLTRNVKAELSCPSLGPSVIYAHRTIGSLAIAIQKLDQTEQAGRAELQKLREEQIEKAFAAHVNEVDRRFRHTNHVILLTGSTGAIGSFLLHALSKAETTTHVYCLNRSLDPARLQAERNKLRKLPAWDPSRVTFLQGEVSSPSFGLTAELYGKLATDVTDVIHAAWPVNWNLPLDTFEPQLGGIVQLIQFGVFALKKPRVIFLSTVAAALGLAGDQNVRSIPETIIDKPSAAATTGYGSSKHIAERLLGHASEKHGLPCTILRIGQVSGPSKRSAGEGWARQEWFPSLVVSSATLGILPDAIAGPDGVSGSAPIIDWIPIDSLADVITELIVTESAPATTNGHARVAKPSTLEVLHLLNPQRTAWSALLPAIQESVSSRTGKPLQVVPLGEWVARVKASSQEALDGQTNGNGSNNDRDGEILLSRIPAIKLLDFFESWLVPAPLFEGKSLFETQLAQARSEVLRKIGPVTVEQMRMWVEGWM